MSTTRAAARQPRRLGPGWVPREHDAWAMLALLARAVVVPRRRPWPRPKADGLGEVGATVVVTAVTLLVLR